MKDSTYEKLSNLAAKVRRIEPKWYLGWALGCALAGGLYGNMSFILIGIMYLFLAEMARQRNEAATIGMKLADRADDWRAIAEGWEDAYYRDMDMPNPRKRDKP